MSDDKIKTFPGTMRTDTPVVTEDTYKAENELVNELQELLMKFDGRVSNVAMVGTLTTYATLISIESMSGD
jgi:hypothetical protein